MNVLEWKAMLSFSLGGQGVKDCVCVGGGWGQATPNKANGGSWTV